MLGSGAVWRFIGGTDWGDTISKRNLRADVTDYFEKSFRRACVASGQWAGHCQRMCAVDIGEAPAQFGAAMTDGEPCDGTFQETQWTLVTIVRLMPGSPQAAEALAKLCKIYWYPLYAFARRSGLGVEDAKDATQGFFACVVRENLFGAALPEKGRLRTFLLAAFRNHMADERDWRQAAKRGGGMEMVPLDFEDGESRYSREPVDPVNPEMLYDRNWARAVMRAALQSLARQEERARRKVQFTVLAEFLSHREDAGADYAAAANRLRMTVDAARKAVSRLREKFRVCVRLQIANTLDAPDSRRVEEEMAALLAALAMHPS